MARMTNLTPQQQKFQFLVENVVRLKMNRNFTRKELAGDKGFMADIERLTKSRTPEQQLSFLLQRLRDAGYAEFVSRGKYRYLAAI